MERTSLLLAAILCCTLTFGIVSPPAYASSWEPETADASDNTGFWADLAFDPAPGLCGRCVRCVGHGATQGVVVRRYLFSTGTPTDVSGPSPRRER